MVTVGVRGGRPVQRQLLRGVGFSVGGLAALIAAAVLVSWANDDGAGQVGATRRLVAIAVVLGVATGAALVWRRLRRWETRPHWLLPAASVLLLAASVPAVYAPALTTSSADACIPILQAWDPIPTRPSDDDLVAVQNIYSQPAFGQRIRLLGQLKVSTAERGTPQYQRVHDYAVWLDSDASCAPASRTHLGWSAAGLGLGAAVLSVAVRRRRTD